MRMLCYKCKHSWNYKGKNTHYITCPGCFYKIRVDKAFIEGPVHQKLLTNLPKIKRLPSKLPKKLPTTNETQPLKIEIPIIKTESERYMEMGFEKCEDQFGKDVYVRNVPWFNIIRTIPRDPIKLIAHQRSFI